MRAGSSSTSSPYAPGADFRFRANARREPQTFEPLKCAHCRGTVHKYLGPSGAARRDRESGVGLKVWRDARIFPTQFGLHYRCMTAEQRAALGVPPPEDGHA
jgi:hypothetical protein